MKFIRKEIAKMSEANLREKVLIPLFEKMGLNNVYHYHGGSGEKGKDIVMWEAGKFNDRTNFAVVVKAKKINGSVENGSGSAGVVATQIQQAFGHNYSDPITSEEQRVNECWIVSSGKISKEAIDSIKAAIKCSNLDRSIRFIDGDQLWSLIRKHFPESMTIESIESGREILEGLDPDWRIAVSTHGGKSSYTIEPKHPAAKPFPLKLKLKFPNMMAASEKQKEIQDSIEKGTSSVIDSTFISQIELPEFLKKIVGPIEKIEIGQRKGQKSLAVYLQIDSDDGSVLKSDPIIFEIERLGTKEVKFSNFNEQGPLKISCLFNHEEKTVTPTFSFDIGSGNVHQLLNTTKLWKALAKNGVATLRTVQAGLQVMKWRTNEIAEGFAPPDPLLLTFLEDLDFVQQTTNQALFIKMSEVTEKDEMNLNKITSLLKTGKFGSSELVAKVPLDRTSAVHFLEEYQNAPQNPLIIFLPRHHEFLIGQKISLGPTVFYMSKPKISEKSIDLLRLEIKDKTRSNFTMAIYADDHTETELFYLESLPTDQELPKCVRDFLGKHRA